MSGVPDHPRRKLLLGAAASMGAVGLAGCGERDLPELRGASVTGDFRVRGDLEVVGAVDAGRLTGGRVQGVGVVIDSAYTQDSSPVDRSVGSPLLIDWRATINEGTAHTGLYGPRAAVQLEGYVQLGKDNSPLDFLPLGYAHMLKVGNVPGQARTLVPAWGFMEAQMFVADGAPVTAIPNDYALGGASFVDARTFLTLNDGEWDGLSGDNELISFLSGTFALGNSAFRRRVAFDVKPFNEQGLVGGGAELARFFNGDIGGSAARLGTEGVTDPGGGTVEDDIGLRVPHLESYGYATRFGIGISNGSRWVNPPRTSPLADATATIDASTTLAVLDNTSGESLTMTSAPTIADGADGQSLFVMNGSADPVTLQDGRSLRGSNLTLAGDSRTLRRGELLHLVFSSSLRSWFEVARSGGRFSSDIEVGVPGEEPLLRLATSGPASVELGPGGTAPPDIRLTRGEPGVIEVSGTAGAGAHIRTAADPVHGDDLVRKSYVDALEARIAALEAAAD